MRRANTSNLGLRQRLLRPVVRWYAHAEFPRYGHLLHWYGMNDQHRAAPTVEVRDRLNGHLMRLDLPDYYQRIAYFFGCYHELDVLTAFAHALRPGDAFVDGGANIGLTTMHAAALVGREGRVDAFECSPRVIERLRFHLDANRLGWVNVREAGLSDEPGSLPLRLPHAGNDAAATFSPLPERYDGQAVELGSIPVVRGDDAIDPADDRPLLIKLDVEGFEVRALRGFARTIERRRPALLTENNPELLSRSGSSVADMTAMLQPMGYKAFALDRGGYRSRHRLSLYTLGPEIQYVRDILWLAEGSVHWRRLEALMTPRVEQWWRVHFCKVVQM